MGLFTAAHRAGDIPEWLQHRSEAPASSPAGFGAGEPPGPLGGHCLVCALGIGLVPGTRGAEPSQEGP